MKKSTIFLFLILIICTCLKPAYATHLRLNVVNMGPAGGLYGNYIYESVCNVDTVIMIAPPAALSGIDWKDPSNNHYYTDSVYVKAPNIGVWTLDYDQNPFPTMYIRIYFETSVPATPPAVHDTVLCTILSASSPYIAYTIDLNSAAATNPIHSYVYLWSSLSTGAVVTCQYGEDFVHYGTFWLELTNSCGSHTDTFTISYSNPDAPHLGLDYGFCPGSSTVLNPQNNNVASYLWSTGATTATLQVNSTGTYHVYTVNSNGCSGADTIHVTSVLPTIGHICYIECDSTTGKNKINWNQTIPANVDSIKIYREVSLYVWSFIGSVDASNSYYIDTSSHPAVQSYSYHITTIDTCGNESDTSSSHTTITLLAAYNSGTNTYGFTWSKYIGLSVPDYYLFGVTSSGSSTLIGSVPGNLNYYNYINPSSVYINYFVCFYAPVCNSFKSTHLVKSNIVNSVISGIDNMSTIPFNLYPNPASDKLIVDLPGFDVNQKIIVSVYNLMGQKILEQKILQEKTEINIERYTKGMYIIKFLNSGSTEIEKFAKE